MKFKNLSYLLAGGLLVIASCKKEDPEPEPDPTPQPSASQLNSFFSDNNANAVQTFTIDAAAPTAITGSQGTVLSFWANSFKDAQGSDVTGNIQIELTEIYGKKDMIFLNKQTLGNNQGTYQPLVSGGEFKISASQGGNEIFLKDGWQYNIQVQAPGGTNLNMDNFYGSNAGDDTLTWNHSDSSFWTDQGSFYDMYFDSLGWINCDYFYSDPNPQTEVQVDVPTGYDNSNCAVFVSFDGLNSMTGVYGHNGTNFTTDYYQLPEGLAVHFIVMAFINNTPYAALPGATIVNGHIEVVSALNATTPTQLATDIQNLP